MNIPKSEILFQEAKKVLPGGVNSPVRAFKGVGGTPLFISKAQGPYLYDVDDHKYIDYVGSWGPMIVGHAHPQVVHAVQTVIAKGTSYGAPTEVETQLAEMVVDAVPSVDMVRFVSSGTEATMSALRLARAYTKRDKIVKFEGGYHGHADMLLAQAGSGVTTLGLPDSPGVPKETVGNTLLARYNDLESVEKLFDAHAEKIAAIIVEPVAGNMGVIPPKPGFLEGLRQVTQKHGALLIFDEVMTGFRIAYGCAQSLFDITPDLTCFGKIIGGGFPVGAYGGKQEIMQMVAPAGPVYQAGTLSGNPVAMTAGIETLKILQQSGSYEKLESLSAKLSNGLKEAADNAGVAIFQTRVGAMSCMYFTENEVSDFQSAKTADTRRYATYFHAMLKRGVYFAPSQFEAAFVSLAHREDDIDKTCSEAFDVMKTL